VYDKAAKARRLFSSRFGVSRQGSHRRAKSRGAAPVAALAASLAAAEFPGSPRFVERNFHAEGVRQTCPINPGGLSVKTGCRALIKARHPVPGA